MHATDSNPDLVIDTILEATAGVPSDELHEVRVGPYWVLVAAGRGAGLSSALRSEAHLHGSKPVSGAGFLHLRTPHELAELLRSESPPEAAIGLAAVNSLLGPAVSGVSEENAAEILRRRGRDRTVAMIGHFPFADRLREQCERLWIFERGLNRGDRDFGEESMAELLPIADVVAVTATTILNRTLSEVLATVRSDAFVMLLGPSTPLTPTLFGLGIDVLCGTVIDDPGVVLRAVEQGAVTSQITGVRRVCLWKED